MQALAPTLEQTLAFCAEEPVERVFLEDVARRNLGRFTAFAENGRLTALCHVGANVVPAGRDCGRFAAAAARGRARMIIGDEHAVGELWERLAERMPPPDRPKPTPFWPSALIPNWVLRRSTSRRSSPLMSAAALAGTSRSAAMPNGIG